MAPKRSSAKDNVKIRKVSSVNVRVKDGKAVQSDVTNVNRQRKAAAIKAGRKSFNKYEGVDSAGKNKNIPKTPVTGAGSGVGKKGAY